MPYGILPPPPGEPIPVSPYAPQMQRPVPGQLPPPPEISQARNQAEAEAAERGKKPGIGLAQLAPSLAGLGMAMFGGKNMSNFGAGFTQGSSSMLMQQNLQARQREADQEQNVIKNVHSQMEKVRRIQDPRYQAAVQEYDQAMQDGSLTGKEAAKIHQTVMGLGDIEQQLGQKDADSKYEQMRREKELERDLKRDELAKFGVPYEVMPGITRNMDPETAARLTQAKVEHERTGKYQDAMMGNMRADNARADRLMRDQEDKYRESADDSNIAAVAEAWANGQIRNYNEALQSLGPARTRGSAGVKLLAYMADKNLMAMPPEIRKRVGEINVTLDTMKQFRGLLDDVVKSADPKDRVKASYLMDSFINSNAASIAAAMGEKGVKTEGDIKRAMGLTPGWLMANTVPELAYKKLDLVKDRFVRNKGELAKTHFMTFSRSTGADSPAGSLAPPPGGGAPTYTVGQIAVNKQTGQKVKFDGKSWVPIQ